MKDLPAINWLRDEKNTILNGTVSREKHKLHVVWMDRALELNKLLIVYLSVTIKCYC